MQINRLLIFFGILFLSFSANAAETYVLDQDHSYVLWRVNHFDFSTQVGKWYVKGTLVLDKDKPQNSKLTATIQVTDIITGLPELDKHLKGKLFFDVTQFPTATYTSDKIVLTGKKSAKVYGNLTVHGVTKPVVLDVTLTQIAKNPITDKMTAGFKATTKIKRSDFGITTLIPGVSDEVELDIGAEAAPAQ